MAPSQKKAAVPKASPLKKEKVNRGICTLPQAR
jgi:hypothetical protein